MSAVYDRVAQLLNEEFGVPTEQISAETTFEELDLDSLDLVEFAMAADDAFGVQIADDEAEQLKSVGDVVALLESKGATVAGG